MLKMTIDNEEVVSDKDITINEEMLSASSTILNNVYPKEWEEDKDYTSRFYYPQDYSKALIQRSYVTQEAEVGTTIQVNGSVTLTDVDTTKNSRVLRLLGQTSQTGTPTPSSPIPVNVVSGDNEINVIGKNLFDKTRLISGKRLDNTGLPSIADNTYCTTDYFIKVEPNTTYYSTSVINQAKAVCFYDNNQEFIERKMYLNINTFTTGATTQFIKISILLSEIDTEQLEKGSSATTYEAYTGNTYNIDLPVLGKNLFNKNLHIINGSFINGSGGISSDSTLSYQDYFIEVEQNTEYTISSSVSTIYRIAKYNSSKTFIDRPYNENPSTSYTINTGNAKYIKMAGTLTTALDSLQIEKNSSATPYEPFNDIEPIELCKIGNYQDYIYKDSDKWYLHKEIGKVVLNGSEDIIRTEAQNNTYRHVVGINTSNIMKINDAMTISPIVSNKLIATSRTGTFAQTQGICYGMESTTSYKDFIIYCEETKNMTVAEFITWLSNNNVTVYYVLSTPTNTEITYEPLIDQLNALTSQ